MLSEDVNLFSLHRLQQSIEARSSFFGLLASFLAAGPLFHCSSSAVILFCDAFGFCSMRNGVRCTQKQDLKSNTALNCFSEASSMGHQRHDADTIEKFRTRMQLISKDSQANMLMILVPAVICWIHAQEQKFPLPPHRKPARLVRPHFLGSSSAFSTICFG
jgi:hypothetical protein